MNQVRVTRGLFLKQRHVKAFVAVSVGQRRHVVVVSQREVETGWCEIVRTREKTNSVATSVWVGQELPALSKKK